MPNEDVLNIAVARDVITQTQADSIKHIDTELNSSQVSSKLPVNADDEGFRFITGFSDIFLAIGAFIVISGLAKISLAEGFGGLLFIAAICWGLSEVFATWQKRSLPSMVSAVGFVYFAGMALFILMRGIHPYELLESADQGIYDPDQLWGLLWSLPAIGFGLSLIYYARFRLPFSLLLAAVNFALWNLMLLLSIADLSESYYIVIPALFLMGLVVFAAAMYYDSKDTRRTQRLSDNAFWLHLVASPLIVHSIMWQSAIWLAGSNRINGVNIEAIATPLSVVVLAIFVVILCVALVIDRRAMLVSSFIYVSVALTYVISSADNLGFAVSVLPIFIGASIIIIGIAWRNLRQLMFSILPLGKFEALLPPVRQPIKATIQG